jgi:hypothetical protein
VIIPLLCHETQRWRHYVPVNVSDRCTMSDAMKLAVILIASALALPSFLDGQTPPSSSPQDSALVAAAKRSNRTGKKHGVVITNETLAHGGASAHVTTTRVQPALAKMPEAAQQPAPASAAPVTPAPKSASSAPKAKTAPHDDAESLTEDLDPEPITCPTCLPILSYAPPGLAVRKMELSTSPPRIEPPQPTQPPEHQQ